MTAQSTQISPSSIYAPGLEGISVARTILSRVDGNKGELIIRGHRIEDIAGHISIQKGASLLWQDFPDAPTKELAQQFGIARQNAFRIVPDIAGYISGNDLMTWMRAALDLIPIGQNHSEAVQICGALQVFVAAASRLAAGFAPIPPDPRLSVSQDILKMLTGTAPTHRMETALDRYLVTIMDHGLNASTFTARVIASTQADMRSAVSGAMGALKGPLHGGAPGPVLDMLDDIGTPDKAESWIAAELKAGHRLMGFGHRIYRVRDPRADVLKAGLDELRQDSNRIQRAEAIEQAALEALKKHKPGRVLETNVEFYTAVLLDAIGIDRNLFTPLFAVGRSIGWAAHIMEQKNSGKLIRPQSDYVGS
ncbi:MAG: citrate synthase/methylcitrate synthase [Cohaesibacteraceae bacterium]|nr:citrate synthase/methylcitrate synthase [Cohaesibacteraceae bacterium]MBL4875075.1 citrate synthase/methylcitrate synthase [Cohaesibacteraceae bacterium]